MFFGKCTIPLRDKSKFTLPTNYRTGLNDVVYLTQGFDRNLLLLSSQAFNTIYSHIKATNLADPLARLLGRLFMGSAVEVAINDLGEVELPSSLSAFAGMDQEIVVVGQGEYFELWSPDLWLEQEASLNELEANSSRFEKFIVPLI